MFTHRICNNLYIYILWYECVRCQSEFCIPMLCQVVSLVLFLYFSVSSFVFPLIFISIPCVYLCGVRLRKHSFIHTYRWMRIRALGLLFVNSVIHIYIEIVIAFHIIIVIVLERVEAIRCFLLLLCSMLGTCIFGISFLKALCNIHTHTRRHTHSQQFICWFLLSEQVKVSMLLFFPFISCYIRKHVHVHKYLRLCFVNQ